MTRIHRLPVWLAAVLCTACVSGEQVERRDEVVEHHIAKARHSGAYRCAPRELATAEADLTFSRQELSDGHSTTAEEFADTAEDAAKKALDLSKNCGPKQVVIAQRVVKVVPVAPKDTDGDGIPDDIDRCPTIPGPKENFGCPWGDRDHDGIPDNLDKCPDVPGIPELQGCPDVDTDGDGIPDRLDKCPTVPGVPPDGCPKVYKLVVVKKDRIEIKQQVHFATGKWRILPDSYELLNEVADAIRSSPKIRVRVEGHTDNVGGAAYNEKLSQHRAEAVTEYLIEHGIDAGRLVARGYGFSRPIASNATRIGRAKNRRVEFNIVKAGESEE